MVITFAQNRCCIKAETGTLIFAIFNVIASSLMSLASILALAYWASDCMLTNDDAEASNSSTQGAQRILYMAYSVVAFVFAVLLAYGIVKKKPEHIKVYYIYGVVVTVLSLLVTVAYLMATTIFGYSESDFAIVAVSLLVCFVYSLILKMVYVAYKKIANNSTGNRTNEDKYHLIKRQHC